MENSKNLNLSTKWGGRGGSKSKIEICSMISISTIIFLYTLKISALSVNRNLEKWSTVARPAVKTPSVNQKIVIALARRECLLWSLRDVVRLKMPPRQGGGHFSVAASHPDTLTLFRDPLNISKTTLEVTEGQREGERRRLKERHASEHTQIFITARTNQPPRALIL